MLAERGTSHSVSLGHRNDSGMTISTANASGSILVVDDQPANLRVVSALLSRHGYEVITADSGEEALAIASEQAPDLMLLDMRSEEHTSELQSLMRNSYAVFCLKKKKQ